MHNTVSVHTALISAHPATNDHENVETLSYSSPLRCVYRIRDVFHEGVRHYFCWSERVINRSRLSFIVDHYHDCWHSCQSPSLQFAA